MLENFNNLYKNNLNNTKKKEHILLFDNQTLMSHRQFN